MRYRVAIVVMLLAGLGGLCWWLLSGDPAPGPIAPQDPATMAMQAAVPAEPDPPPAVPALPSAPIAPAPAANDPAQGVITLRVVDADTEQPMANTLCGLSGMYTSLDAEGRGKQTSMGNLYVDAASTSRSGLAQAFTETDGQGLIRFGVATERPFTGSQFTNVMFFEQMVWRLPTPGGREPAFEVHDIACRIAALRREPQQTAIDVRWRRAPSVTCAVRSQDGTPVQGAKIMCFATSAPREINAWARSVSFTFSKLQESGNPATELTACVESMRKEMADRGWHGLMLKYKSDERPALNVTDAAGRYTTRGLFRGDWVFCVWHPMFEPHFESAKLEPREHELHFTLRPGGNAALRVIANVMEGDVRVKQVHIRVTLSGPYGPRHHSAPEEFESVEKAPWSHEFIGLIPATYHVQIWAPSEGDEEWGVGNTTLVTLAPNETREVVLPVGKGATAYWEPVVMAGGERLPRVGFTLRGGPYVHPEPFHLEGDKREAALAPGEYTAELPDVGTIKFQLAPGQRRTDQFIVPLRSVTFTLANDVMQPNEENHSASLDLFPAEISPGVDWEFHAASAVPGDRSLRLVPGTPLHCKLVPGRYRWELSGMYEYAGGSLEVIPAGANVFTFSLDSMPGVARLDVDLTAYESAGLETPDLCLERPMRRALDADHGWRNREYHDKELIIRRVHQPGQAMMFAPSDRWILHVGDERRFVTVPGKVTLRPGDAPARVKWTGAAAPETIFVEAIDSFGLAREVHQSGAAVAKGRLRVYARRTTPAKAEYAATTLDVTEGEHVIELDKLEWERCGAFTIECEGRGSPEAATDAWWMVNPFGHKTPVRVVALDREDALGPAMIAPSEDASWFPGPRLAFRFHPHDAPAGRYKVIPWPNAPEKYCVTFTVKPGANTDVLVKGG